MLMLATIGNACVSVASTIRSNGRNIMIIFGMLLVVVMASGVAMVTIQAGMSMLKNAPAPLTMNHEVRAETSVMALPASSAERRSIALDSGCFLTVSNMSSFFTLLKPCEHYMFHLYSISVCT